ncbi:DUF505 domain-containing protein [Desulfurobacterium atlanticum]|uniref:DUF505 domain-containing protein n=1 Tax=Desulfurobacterium atlanticum TaxID=240169 RepID=A0A238ZBM6_9BACT|nr:DUF505 domain-containing protein [Desulfurobacterium atlanticum]SNR80331.1 hypothetical protein SAMN06265340_10773 [Desulfurobacterium atlanticum]
MVIRKEHALALMRLKEMEEGKFYTVPEGEEAPFIELEMANLARMGNPFEYVLTYWGEVLVNTLSEMVEKGLIAHPEKWDDEFRWIGTEVIAMIDASIKNGDICGGLIEKELSKRGFVEEKKIEKKGTFKVVNDFGKAIMDIFNNATPRLIVSRELKEFIKNAPTGPAESSFIKGESRFPLILESMRLIAFSVPTSDVYTFTALGEKVKQACELIPPVRDVIISEDIMDTLAECFDEGIDAVDEEGKELLWELALVDDKGELLPAGEALLEVYRVWRDRESLPVKTVDVEAIDAELLKGIEEVWEKNKENPEVVPTVEELVHYLFYKPLKEYKHVLEHYGRRLYQDLGYQKKEEIKKKFEEVKTAEELFKSFYEKGNQWYEKLFDIVQESLYTLESFGIIKSSDHNGKKVHRLTEWGEKILQDMKRRGFRRISSTAVKSITIKHRVFGAPNVDWYEEAVNAQLVGGGEPTEAGKLYEEVAYKAKRLPHITRFELQVLHKIPERGYFIDNLYEEFDETWHEEIEFAINKLEARGYIDILPNRAIVLTEVGSLIKRALAGTPEGFGNPITPLGVRVLDALRKVGTLYVKEQKIRVLPKNLKEAIKLSGLDEETFGKELLILKNAKLVGKNSINEAGLLVLEALDKLN